MIRHILSSICRQASKFFSNDEWLGQPASVWLGQNVSADGGSRFMG